MSNLIKNAPVYSTICTIIIYVSMRYFLTVDTDFFEMLKTILGITGIIGFPDF